MRRKIIGMIISMVLCFAWIDFAHAGACHYFDIDITAVVSPVEGGWLYQYTISRVEEGYEDCIFKDMSHWWIELPEHKIETLSDFDPKASVPSGEDITFNETGAGDIGELTTLGNPFNGSHYGVKWDSSELITYSFISTHSPVEDEDGEWDFSAYSWFAKDGVGYYDYGATVGPNGGLPPYVIPEPASMLLVGIGALGVGAYRRRKNKW